ncbi:SIR2 family protein [Priestia filamentosa]|uniref:SIR2 family protein n=1 Tax=Priestia filamentosa TaxID=1402861 RepID=UPI000E75E076|nr:SIR2 family protein [Priestia filamentosa]RJS63083.1 hypothetical protein CJ485_23035 [Priestia filamentosa]
MNAFLEESKEIIRNAISNNKIIFFVGSGVSKNSGYPLWNEFVERFAKGIYTEENRPKQMDLLKVPQYYYNSRGSKEYIDVINDVFNIKASPNDIHQKILDFTPQHIITTNYDSLVEEASENRGLFYSVVAKDEDLPYILDNKMIIKMHGDLKNKNIVLKEDDYLSYETNFRLIANYIRALLSTHVVIFVGYSLQDSNFNLIFQSVKDILTKNFQPSYFLSTDNFDMIEFDYYKRRGINVIYQSQIEEFYGNKHIMEKYNLQEKGKQLCYALDFLLDDVFIKKNDNHIDDMYFELKELSKLQKIFQKDIKALFKFQHISIKNQYIEIINDGHKEYERFIKILQGYYSEKDDAKKYGSKIEFIINSFLKAGIKGIKYITFDASFPEENLIEFKVSNIKNTPYNEIHKKFLELDFRGLKSWIKENYVTVDDNFKDIQKAFVLSHNGEYYNAYNTLKNLSKNTLKNKDYFIYMLSEFNRINVGRIIIGSLLIPDVPKDEIDAIRKEVEQIDLEEVFINLPKQVRESLSFLKKLMSFSLVYEMSSDILGYDKKIEKELDTLYGGFDSKDVQGKIHEVKDKIKDFWEFLNFNCLIVDHYTEVKSLYSTYLDYILKSYSNLLCKGDQKQYETFFGMTGRFVGIRQLDSFDFLMIIRYVKRKDVVEMLNKYNIKEIKVSSEELKVILKMFNNLIDSFPDLNWPVSRREYLETLLYLLSLVKLNQEEMLHILKRIVVLLTNQKNICNSSISGINRFLVFQMDDTIDSLIIEQLEEILEKLLIAVLLNKQKVKDITPYRHLLNNIATIIQKVNKSYVVSEKISSLIQIVYKEESSELVELTEILKVLPEGEKTFFVNDLLKGLEKNFNPNIYFDLTNTGLIPTSKEFEDKLYLSLKRMIKNKKETKNLTDSLEETLLKVSILFLREQIIDKNRFKEFKGISKKFDLLIDINGFDYNEFELEWIDEFPEWIHELIANNIEGKEHIKSKMKENILNNNASKKFINIFFKFYD